MIHVSLVRPINPSGSAYLRKFGFLPVPLGLLDLAAVIQDIDDIQIKIIDMEAENIGIPEVVKQLDDFGTDVLGITIHATASHEIALDIVRELKKRRNFLAIAGGHHATFLPRTLIKGGFDVVVLGEGEGAFRDVIEHSMEGLPLDDVDGIVFQRNGEIIRTNPRKLIHNLDTLPPPPYHLIDREKYRFDLFGENQYVGALETSRGCPYACDFCSVTPTWGNLWRNKTNPKIIEELENIKKYGYNWVFFVDDIFIVQPNLKNRVELFDEIIERDFNMNFIVQMRADITSKYPDVIKKAGEAGVKIAFIGAESGSPEVLKKMHKGIVIDQTVRAIENLKKAHIIVLVGMMVGAPYERFRDLWATLKMSRNLAKHGADALQMSIYTPLPGTRIMRDAIKNDLIIQENLGSYDVLTPVIRTKVGTPISQIMQLYIAYSFYLYKYLKGRIKSTLSDPVNKILLDNATRYMMNDLGTYVKEVLNIPRTLLRTRKLSIRGKNFPDDIKEELLETLTKAVYDTEGRKNPYFMIGDNTS